MTFSSSNEPSSIFEDGKLKPGIYKIQNLYSQTYLDIHEHSKATCGRPAENLEEGRGLVRQLCGPWFAHLMITSGKSSLSGLGILYGG